MFSFDQNRVEELSEPAFELIGAFFWRMYMAKIAIGFSIGGAVVGAFELGSGGFRLGADFFGVINWLSIYLGILIGLLWVRARVRALRSKKSGAQYRFSIIDRTGSENTTLKNFVLVSWSLFWRSTAVAWLVFLPVVWVASVLGFEASVAGSLAGIAGIYLAFFWLLIFSPANRTPIVISQVHNG